MAAIVSESILRRCVNFDDQKQSESLSTIATTTTSSSSSSIYSSVAAIETPLQSQHHQQQQDASMADLTKAAQVPNIQRYDNSGTAAPLPTSICTDDESNDSSASDSESEESVGGGGGAAMETEIDSEARVSMVTSSAATTASVSQDDSRFRRPSKSTSAGTSVAADDHADDDGDNDNDEPSVKRKRRPRPPTGVRLQCAVCGDVAFGYNFDAVSCESCKAFFRRNAMRQHVCQNGNQCKIDKESRKYCSSCRLTKCLEMGMKRELILSPAKLEKRAKLVRKKHVHHSGSSASTGQSQSIAGSSTPSSSGVPLFTPSDLQGGSAPRNRKTERLPSSASTGPSSCGPATSHCESCDGSLKHDLSGDSPCAYANIDFGVSGPAAVAYAAAMFGQRVGAPSSFVAQSIFPGVKPDLSAFSSGCATDLLGLASTGRATSLLAAARGEPVAQHFHPEAVLAEMARLGLDVVAAVNAAASQQRRSSGSLGAPSPISQVKQELPCASPSLFISRSPASEYRSLTGMSLPSVNYEEIIGKCTTACEQLLRPLNGSDTRQMRPANVAHEQFNYGEVFVRRFVIAFKQIPDFRGLTQASQLKLLRNSMVSTLNIAGVFSFDVARQAWVLQVENCEERVYLISDMIALFESSGQTHIRDYMHSYCEFHTRLRNEFGNDVILFFVLILIDMFSPHRFAADRDMLALLVPAHARYVQFLELYLVANYGSKHRSSSGSLGSPHSAFGLPGFGRVLPGGPQTSSTRPGSPLEPIVKQKLDFCLDTLSSARILEEYLSITSQYIGLTAMLPLLAEVCEFQLNASSDTE